MAMSMFRVSRGLELDNIQLLEGAGVPGAAGDTSTAPAGSIYTDNASGLLYTKIAAGAGVDKWSVQATTSYVDGEISILETAITNLGNAFNYVGTVTGGVDAGTAFDLTTLTEKNAGDYYKVTTSGYFSNGTTFFANVGDGLVWNLTAGVDKIDNTNSEVAGTTDYISVAGSADVGFTVDVAPAFKTRVSTAESDIISLDGRLDTAESDINAVEGRMSTAESDIDNIETEMGYVQTFIGKTPGVDAPAYTSTTQVTQGVSLEAAIGSLDSSIGADVTNNTIVNGSSTVNANIQAIANYVEESGKVVAVTSAQTASDSVATAMAKWFVYIQESGTPANVVGYEIFAVSNGASIDFNRYGILKLGSAISGVAADVTQSGANMVLTVTSGVNCNITIKRSATI